MRKVMVSIKARLFGKRSNLARRMKLFGHFKNQRCLRLDKLKREKVTPVQSIATSQKVLCKLTRLIESGRNFWKHCLIKKILKEARLSIWTMIWWKCQMSRIATLQERLLETKHPRHFCSQRMSSKVWRWAWANTYSSRRNATTTVSSSTTYYFGPCLNTDLNLPTTSLWITKQIARL